MIRPAADTRAARIAAAVALVVLLAVLAVGLGRSQAGSRRALEHRYRDRVTLAATFVETYLDDLRGRALEQAELHLAAADVDRGAFDAACAAMGFRAAVLLDARGRVIHAEPRADDLVGTELASRYRHLSDALTGRFSVSEVVRSAVEGRAIVAFALPFRSVSGASRVFSGGFDAGRSPVGRYLGRSLPIPGHELYLVDHRGSIVAASRDVGEAESLAQVRPALWGATQTTSVGTVEIDDRQYFGVARPVRGTQLRLIGAAPAATLLAPVGGTSRWLPWGLLAILGVVAAGTVTLLFRLLGSQASLRSANTELDQLSRHDRLTGLHNRRHLEEELGRLGQAARRRGEPFAVLVMDLDRFKAINDTLGHHAGDEVLRVVANSIAASVRPDDVVGRWGGEEFVAVLPRTTAAQACELAERIRERIAALPLALSTDPVAVTISIGCASGSPEDPLALVAEADGALYEAKRGGRNRVVCAERAVRCPSCGDAVAVRTVRLRFEDGDRQFRCPSCAGEITTAALQAAVS